MRLARISIGVAGVLAAAGTLALAGVTVDFEKSVDFSKFKTYQWKEGTTLPNPMMQERLKAAIEKELQAKGVTPVADKSDLVVTTHGRLETQKSVDLTTYGYGGYYGWGGAGISTSSATVREIPVGTLIVDLVDAGSNKLVWRGTGTDVVSDKPAKNEAKINKLIPKMFKNYPPAPKK